MISTKGRYALRVMLDLAENGKNGFVPLKEIAERQGISKKYLEIIVKELVKGKLVHGASGKGGGYALTRAADDYSIGEIIELTEGEITSVACLSGGANKCPRAKNCKTLPLWSEYNALIKKFFYSKKLTDLL